VNVKVRDEPNSRWHVEPEERHERGGRGGTG
jgi:hypothetical protein